MTGLPPDRNVPDVAAPFSHEETWTPFPADLKGIRVYSATNQMVAMLE